MAKYVNSKKPQVATLQQECVGTPEQIAYQEKLSQEAMREMTRGSVKIDK